MSHNRNFSSKKLIKAMLVGACALTVSGCSVVMAATASEEPNLTVLRKGTTRNALEAEIGKPIFSTRERTHDYATYQYFTGDEASYQRAAVYTVLDIVTVGVAEIFTTPIEALQGDKHVVRISYDLNDRVDSIHVSSSKAPLEKPEKMLGIDEEAQASRKSVRGAMAQKAQGKK